MSSPPTVTLEEVKRGLAEKSIFLVDVCNLIVGEEKIPGSKNIPLEELDAALKLDGKEFRSEYRFAKPSRTDLVVTHSDRGVRGKKAVEVFKNNGFANVQVFVGGFSEWKEKGEEVDNYSLSEHPHPGRMDVSALRAGLDGYFFLLMDVRSPRQWRMKRISGSFNVPLCDIEESFSSEVEEMEFFLWYGFLRPRSAEAPLVLICEDGSDSVKAEEKLKKLGFLEAVVFEGGLKRWEQMKGPMVSS